MDISLAPQHFSFPSRNKAVGADGVARRSPELGPCLIQPSIAMQDLAGVWLDLAAAPQPWSQPQSSWAPPAALAPVPVLVLSPCSFVSPFCSMPWCPAAASNTPINASEKGLSPLDLPEQGQRCLHPWTAGALAPCCQPRVCRGGSWGAVQSPPRSSIILSLSLNPTMGAVPDSLLGAVVHVSLPGE